MNRLRVHLRGRPRDGRKGRAQVRCLAILAAVASLAGCGVDRRSAAAVRAEFVPGGVLLGIPPRAGGGILAVETADGGELLARRQWPGETGAALFLPLAWRAGQEYRLLVQPRRGPVRSAILRTPSPDRTPPVELHLPAGTAGSNRDRLAAPPGSRIDGQIRLSLAGSEPAVVTLDLERDPELGWQIDATDPGSLAGAEAFRWIVRLTPADPVRTIPIRVSMPRDAPAGREFSLRLLHRYVTAGAVYEGDSRTLLAPMDPASLRDRITIRSVFPCGPSGEIDPRRAPDVIALPPAWLAWAAQRLGLRAAPVSAWDPVGFQRVTVSSDAEVHLPVVVRTAVLTADGARTAEAFQRPGTGPTRLEGVDRFLIDIPPRAAGSAALPLFAAPDVAPGQYLREIRVTAAGTDIELARARFPLSVSRARSWEQGGTLLSVLLAAGFFAAAPRAARSAFRRLGARELVTIALFAGLTVAAVHLPLLVGGALFVGLLGPFSFLVNSLLGQGLSSALLAALLCLVPARGALALAVIVRYGLGAVMFGAASPLDVLFAASSIPLLEGAVFLSGVGAEGAGGRRPGAAFVFWLALASAATNALHLLVSASVFRLFFAPWYYVLFALTCGFYAGLGARLGLALGRGLRRVQE